MLSVSKVEWRVQKIAVGVSKWRINQVGLNFAAFQFFDIFCGAHASMFFKYIEKGDSGGKSRLLTDAFEGFFLEFTVLDFPDGFIESMAISVIHETFGAVISEIKGDVVLGNAGSYG